MAKKPFGGKQASPFRAGGGRDTSHKNTAKGEPRKKPAPAPKKGK